MYFTALSFPLHHNLASIPWVLCSFISLQCIGNARKITATKIPRRVEQLNRLYFQLKYLDAIYVSNSSYQGEQFPFTNLFFPHETRTDFFCKSGGIQERELMIVECVFFFSFFAMIKV